jgi:hypothetical protein
MDDDRLNPACTIARALDFVNGRLSRGEARAAVRIRFRVHKETLPGEPERVLA